MAHATDVIPKVPDLMGRLSALPPWALERAVEIVDPDCPPPGILYPLPAPQKLFLRLTIGEALVEASKRGEVTP